MRPRCLSANRCCLAITAVTVAALAGVASAQPVAFTQWTFNNLPTGQIINNPAPSTGRGTALPLGMTNTYTYSTSPVRTGSIAAAEVTSANTGSSDPMNIKFWRVRGSFDGTLANAGVGYALAAPQFSQGAEFDVSTLNFSDIVFSFDWFTTNQGVKNMQVQYSLNAGTNWTSIGPVLTAVTNGWKNGNTVDLSGIVGANDNPNFRIRLVSVYDQSLTPPAYASATSGPYNNASGNWRFDMVTFTGNAIRSVGPAGTGDVSPPAVCSSGGSLTFTVTAQSGAGPISTNLAVTADLSPLGLSAAQAFRDDGTNGDAFAGDGVFTFVAAVPAGRPVGPVSINAMISDGQSRTGMTTIAATVGNCSTNSASRVVISQLYGAGGNTPDLTTGQGPLTNADYVELYNRSASAVNIDGWSVQYASQGSIAGFDSTGDRVLLRGTVQPGQRLLVQMSDPVNGFAALPTPDFAQRFGFGGMGNTGGRVALVRSSTLLGTNYNDVAIEDFVGYGNGAITFEGNGPVATPNPVLTTALVRKQDGAQDTNQNFNDFAFGTVNPRNRADGGFLAGFPAASLSAVCAGSPVILSARVSPSSAGGVAVSADVSGVVGAPATVQLLDNGLNGDAQAGDGVYSVAYNVPSTAAQGSRTVAITVTDSLGRSDTSTLPLDVGNCGNSNAAVVISKVYGGGGNSTSGYEADFAEIFNRSSAPVSLDGWSFQSARITDLTGFVNRICLLSGVINPGEYRLIATNQLAGASGGAIIPTPDFRPAVPFGMESSFGRVVLVSTSNLVGTEFTRSDVVDLVGYGFGVDSFEGVAAAGTLSDILYAQRKQGGCQDTNQNAIDFDVLLALTLPNNAATPAVPCPLLCLADLAGGVNGGPDGIVDGNDFVAFINAFGASDPLADVAGGVNGGADGIVDGNDFVAFINAFGAGC